MQTRKEMKRGAYRREDCVFIGAWFPSELLAAIDRVVVSKDSDRSKILRSAVLEKIRKEAV
jgi:metal-responsive CopG/Arc/MetJ family transcriptional regulator